jgi:hypothetical protein
LNSISDAHRLPLPCPPFTFGPVLPGKVTQNAKIKTEKKAGKGRKKRGGFRADDESVAAEKSAPE